MSADGVVSDDGFHLVEDGCEFAGIEPESVGFGAVIEDYGGVALGGFFGHFFVAFGAFAKFFSFGDLGWGTDGEEGFGFFFVAEDEFEFARIEPDAFALGAIVDFDFVEFEGYEDFGFAAWTVQRATLDSVVNRRMWKSRCDECSSQRLIMKD